MQDVSSCLVPFLVSSTVINTIFVVYRCSFLLVFVCFFLWGVGGGGGVVFAGDDLTFLSKSSNNGRHIIRHYLCSYDYLPKGQY